MQNTSRRIHHHTHATLAQNLKIGLHWVLAGLGGVALVSMAIAYSIWQANPYALGLNLILIIVIYIKYKNHPMEAFISMNIIISILFFLYSGFCWIGQGSYNLFAQEIANEINKKTPSQRAINLANTNPKCDDFLEFIYLTKVCPVIATQKNAANEIEKMLNDKMLKSIIINSCIKNNIQRPTAMCNTNAIYVIENTYLISKEDAHTNVYESSFIHNKGN